MITTAQYNRLRPVFAQFVPYGLEENLAACWGKMAAREGHQKGLPETGTNRGRAAAADLAENEAQVMRVVAERGQISAKKCAEHLGKPYHTVARWMRTLTEQGKLSRTCIRAVNYYQVIE